MPLPIRITMPAARVNAGMTQEELAKRMGVSRFTVINWENHKTKPSKAQLHLFCDVCAIPEDNIFLP